MSLFNNNSSLLLTSSLKACTTLDIQYGIDLSQQPYEAGIIFYSLHLEFPLPNSPPDSLHVHFFMPFWFPLKCRLLREVFPHDPIQNSSE